MTTTTKAILAFVGAVIIGGAIVGAYYYPKYEVPAGSATGSTFNSAKTAMIVWAPTSATATTTSLYNGDASDRIIKQAQYKCTGFNATFFALTGAGVANVILTAATTSTNAPATVTPVNGIQVLSTTVATGTDAVYVASTTPGTTGTALNRVWNSGSYLTFQLNATSSAASCVIGVDYFGI